MLLRRSSLLLIFSYLFGILQAKNQLLLEICSSFVCKTLGMESSFAKPAVTSLPIYQVALMRRDVVLHSPLFVLLIAHME